MERFANISRLAQYRPLEREGFSSRTAMEEMVLAASAAQKGLIGSPEDCRSLLDGEWGIQISEEEAQVLLTGLEEEGYIEYVGERYHLARRAREELEDGRTKFEVLEKGAFEDWEVQVRAIAPNLTQSDLWNLQNDLRVWLKRIIERHGMDAALLLYPGDERTLKLVNEIKELGTSFLPPRNKNVQGVRELALHQFILRPSSNQEGWLGRILGASYFYTILTIDSSASALMGKILKGQRLYLDTNILFRLFGLQGEDKVPFVTRLIAMSTQLGFIPCVTPWTVGEMRNRLKIDYGFTVKNPPPSPEFADVAASQSDDQNFVTAYWRWHKRTGGTPDDFFNYWDEIETHLSSKGIQICDDGCNAVQGDQTAIDKEVARLGTVPRGEPKPVGTREHDVKHWLLLKNLRGNEHRGFANGGYWFLTADQTLPVYDKEARRNKGLPIIVSSSVWFNIISSFLPKVKDYDSTLARLISSPYITYRTRIKYTTVQKAIAVTSQFENMAPELATRIFLNTRLLREVQAEDDQERQEVKLSEGIVTEAKKVIEELQELKRSKENVAAAPRGMESETFKVYRQKIEDLEVIVKRLEKRIRRRNRRQSRKQKSPGGSAPQKSQPKEMPGETSEDDGDSEPKLNRQPILSIVLVAATILAVLLFNLLLTNDSLNQIARAALIMGLAISAASVIAIVTGGRKFNQILFWILTVIGAFAAVLQSLDIADKP